MIHSTTLRLIDQIESGYEQHRADTDRIRAELQAKSEAAHPSRVARRNEVDAENARRVRVLRMPSPQSSVDAFDALGCVLADVIDLGAKRGERA